MPTKARLKLISQTTSNAPDHLGVAGQELWDSIQATFGIDDALGLTLLAAACEAADRTTSAKEMIDEQGLLLGRKVHPVIQVEQSSRNQMVRCLKALNLDLEPLRASAGRPAGYHPTTKKAS